MPVLRSVVLAIGVVCMAGGAIGFLVGHFPPGSMFFLWGALLVVGTAYERFRYKPLVAKAPGPGWTKTPERFVDDETGKNVTVYEKTETGERQYVRE